MTDQWKHVWGFSRYLISREGVVKSRETGLFILQEPGRDGCMTVTLTANSGTRFIKKVCRLVLDSFDWTDEGYAPIYHLDGNKRNNHFDNLRRRVEVDTDISRRRAESVIVPEMKIPEAPKEKQSEEKQIPKKRGMPDRRAVRVVQTGEEFESVFKMCQLLGLDHSTVGKMLRGVGRNATHHGFTFEYVDNTKKVGIRVIETGEIFATLTELKNAYHVDTSNVSKILRNQGSYKSAGGFTFAYVTEEVEPAPQIKKSKYRGVPVRIVETGMEFPSQSALAKYLNVHRGNVSEVMHRPSKTLRGFHFEFVE